MRIGRKMFRMLTIGKLLVYNHRPEGRLFSCRGGPKTQEVPAFLLLWNNLIPQLQEVLSQEAGAIQPPLILGQPFQASRYRLMLARLSAQVVHPGS